MRLAEIVEQETRREACVLLDTNILSHPNLSREIYGIRYSSKLDQGLLLKVKDILDEVYVVLGNKKIEIVFPVFEELQDIQRIIRVKQTYINSNDQARAKANRKKCDRRVIQNSLFSDLALRINQIIQRAKKRTRNLPSGVGYIACKNLVLYLSKEFDLKNKAHLPDGKREVEESKISNGNDEELVAYTLYNSIINNQRTSIVSKDLDVYRMTIIASFVLEKYFYRELRKHPIQIYTKEFNELGLTFSSERGTEDPLFGIRIDTIKGIYTIKDYTKKEAEERLSNWDKKRKILNWASVINGYEK